MRVRVLPLAQSLSLGLFAAAVEAARAAAPEAAAAAGDAAAETAAPVRRRDLVVRPPADVPGTERTGTPDRVPAAYRGDPSTGGGTRGGQRRPDVSYGGDVVFRRGEVDVEIGEVQYLLDGICQSRTYRIPTMNFLKMRNLDDACVKFHEDKVSGSESQREPFCLAKSPSRP